MAGWSWVFNFANSILGVGILAMPYCFSKCGILLATVMALVSGAVCKKTCEYLLRAASFTRKSTFEQIAFHVYGNLGKLVTEMSVMSLLIGTLVAFQVVIGDLSPAVIHHVLGLQESWTLRTILMIASAGVVIPLCLMRNMSSLASLNAISMSFYIFFNFVIVCFALPNVFSMESWQSINFWRIEAFFQCLPIIFVAYCCQAQVLIMYGALPDPNMKTMTEIINKAINLVSVIYIVTGIFGYVAFYQHGIHGDILENFSHGFFTDALKLGFWLSVVLSFPLIVFPVRAAINSLLYANKKQGVLHDVIASASDYIAPDKFTYITLSLVFGTLVVGILVPNIEIVLSITGALVGTFLGFIYPSTLYIKSGAKGNPRKIAQVILVVSVFIMVGSTMTLVSGVKKGESDSVRPAHIDEPVHLVNPVRMVDSVIPGVPIQPIRDTLLKELKKKAPHLDSIGANQVIKNIIKPIVKEQSPVKIPDVNHVEKPGINELPEKNDKAYGNKVVKTEAGENAKKDLEVSVTKSQVLKAKKGDEKAVQNKEPVSKKELEQNIQLVGKNEQDQKNPIDIEKKKSKEELLIHKNEETVKETKANKSVNDQVNVTQKVAEKTNVSVSSKSPTVKTVRNRDILSS